MCRKSSCCVRLDASDDERSCVLKILIAYICSVVDDPLLRNLTLDVCYLVDVEAVVCLNIRLSRLYLDGDHLSGVAEWLIRKAEKNKPKIDRYGFLGLMLFVGIPLPGTGAWTGSLVASLFDMDLKKASISILLGIFLAAVIMTVFSYGLLGNLIS